MIVHHKSFKILVRLERFELPAYRFVACCSIQLSYERVTKEAILNGILRQAFFVTIFACMPDKFSNSLPLSRHPPNYACRKSEDKRQNTSHRLIQLQCR